MLAAVDFRAVLYLLTLVVALVADAVYLVLAWLWQKRLAGGFAATLAAIGVQAAVTVFATVAHYVSVRGEVERFGAESLWPMFLNAGGSGMAVVHLGGALTVGLLLMAALSRAAG